MARRGTGRGRREEVLEMIERADPQRHAELLELRHQNPQGYRRAMQKLADDFALHAPIRGRGVAADEPGTPGRETDPALQVGAARPIAPDAATPAPRPAPRRKAATPPAEVLPDKTATRPRKGKKET